MKIRYALALAAAITVGVVGCSNSPTSFLSDKLELDLIGEQSGSGDSIVHAHEYFDQDSFDRVEIDGEVLSIEVVPSDGLQGKAELRIDSGLANQVNYKSNLDRGTLHISVTEKKKSNLQKHKGERKLVLALPARELEQLKIANNFGSVTVRDVTTDRLDVTLNIGKVEVSDVSAELAIKTETGDVEVRQSMLAHDADIVTATGAVRLFLEEGPADASLSLTSEIGKVTASLPGAEVREQSVNRWVASLGDGGPDVRIKSEIGPIELHTRE